MSCGDPLLDGTALPRASIFTPDPIRSTEAQNAQVTTSTRIRRTELAKKKFILFTKGGMEEKRFSKQCSEQKINLPALFNEIPAGKCQYQLVVCSPHGDRRKEMEMV